MWQVIVSFLVLFYALCDPSRRNFLFFFGAIRLRGKTSLHFTGLCAWILGVASGKFSSFLKVGCLKFAIKPNRNALVESTKTTDLILSPGVAFVLCTACLLPAVPPLQPCQLSSRTF